MPLGSTLDMNLLDEDKTLRELDDDEHGSFVSALAGIGSGLFKIPEQFVSLGAELIDLGLDTDTAASVESFFDRINPFDEIAESTTAGKLTETFVSLGIPSTAGYTLATRLAGKALKAKRLNKYVDLKRFGNAKTLKEKKEALRLDKLKDPVTGKRRRANKALQEEVDRLTPPELRNRSLKDKAYVFGAGLGGGGLADFVFADPDIGTIGDEFGGITRRDTQETFGRDEAIREIGNRLKFAGEGAILTSVIGGVGKGIAKGAGAIKYKMQYDALDNSIKKIIADFTPQGVKPREIFELLETRKNELGKFTVEGQAFGRQLEITVDKILKETGKKGDELKAIKQEFGEAINTFLTSGERSSLDTYLNKLGVANPELTQKLFSGIDNARSTIDNYSNAILDIIPDNEQFKFLRKAIKDNLGEYSTTRYALIERHGALGKAFSKFKPTDEAYAKAYKYVLGKIELGRKSLKDGADPSDQKFKGIVPKSGMAPEDQAKDILNKLIQEDVGKAVTNLPGNESLKALGLMVDDGILKEKKLPQELKEFFGEIKNPFFNISSTIAKQGALITEVEMLGQLGKLTKDKIFFENADDAAKALGARKGDIVPIGKLSKTLNVDQDISGLYTTREIADAFENQVKGGEEGALSKLYSFFVLAPKSGSQQAKTIFSPFTHVRNLLSASAFTMLNGNISFTDPKRTVNAFKKSFGAFQKGRDSQEAFDLYLDYTRRGITGTNPVIGEMIDLGSRLQPVDNFGADTVLNNTFDVVAQKFSRLRGKITDTYMAEDDFWKIYNYTFEQGNYNNFMSKFVMRNPELKEMGEAKGKEVVSKLIKGSKDLENIPKTVVDAQGITVANPLYETARKNRMNILKTETGLKNPEAVVEQLRKKVGRLMGRRDITFSDPIFFQPKNTIKRLEGESDASFAGRLGQEGSRVEEDAVEALVKNLSADVTKNNIPNYAYVGNNIKALRKLPLGTFVAFPAEIIRTGFNTIQRAARELAVEETRDIGMRRMTGVLGTGAALPVGAVELGKQLSQFTDEEMSALRRFVPSWSENSLLVPTGRDADTGNVQYLDLSYIYPYDSLLRPARTVMNQLTEGESTNAGITARLTEGGIKAMSELAKPFLSEAIFIEAANDILLRGGRTRQGSQVFRDADPLGEKLFKMTMHVMDTFTPGSLDAATRIGGAPFNVADKYGRTYDLSDEALGIFGFRNIEVDPAQSFKFMVGDFNKRTSSARATFLGDVLKGGAITPQQILKEYLGAEESRFNAYQDMYKNYKAAELLGIKPLDLNRQLDRLPKKTKGAIIGGTYQPYKPSKEVRKLFYENSLRLAQQTGSAPIDPLQGSLTKIYDYIAANNGRSLLSDLNVNFEVPESSIIDNVADFFGLQGVQQSASNVQGQQPNVNVTGGAGRVITNTQTLDSQLAADTLLGDDPLLQEIYRQRNT